MDPTRSYVVPGAREVRAVIDRRGVVVASLLHAAEHTVVARDLNLSQAEGDLVFDPEDHAELGSEDAASLRVVGESLARPASWSAGPIGPEIFSNRVFVIRALSALGQVAALLVLAGAPDSRRRTPFSVNVALTFKTEGDRARDIKLVVDHAGLARCREAEWTPRL